MNIEKNINKTEILQYAVENNIIDFTYVQEQIEMRKRKEYLEKHPYEVWKGKDNAWYTYFPDKKNGRKLKRRTDKKKLESDIVNYYITLDENPYITDLFHKWNDERRDNGEIHGNSHTRYANDFKRFFLDDDYICTIPIKEITEADLVDFIKTNIIRYSLTNKAYASLRTLLMGVFKYAKMYKMTDISISTFFSDLQLSKNLFKKKKKKDSEQVFNDDEIKKLAKYFMDHPSIYNYGLLLLFDSGLRIGELVALRPENITQEGILIDSTEIYYKDKETHKIIYEIKENPKMDAESRVVVIPDSTRTIIKRIRLMNSFGEYLFMNNGKRINSTRFNYHLYKACDAVGIPRRSTHCIRKTYASKLLDAEVEESIVKTQMGHTDIKTTRDYYYYSTQNPEYKKMQISRAINE